MMWEIRLYGNQGKYVVLGHLTARHYVLARLRAYRKFRIKNSLKSQIIPVVI